VDDTPHELPEDSEELLNGPTAPRVNNKAAQDAPEYWVDSDLDSAPAPHKPYVKAGDKHKYKDEPAPAYDEDDEPAPYKPPTHSKQPKYDAEDEAEDFASQLKPKPSKGEETYEEPEQDAAGYTPAPVPVVKPYKPKYPKHKYAPEGGEDDASDAPRYTKKNSKKQKKRYEQEAEEEQEETYHPGSHAHHHQPHAHRACIPTGEWAAGHGCRLIAEPGCCQWSPLTRAAGAGPGVGALTAPESCDA
jgi:hypothetical protein